LKSLKVRNRKSTAEGLQFLSIPPITINIEREFSTTSWFLNERRTSLQLDKLENVLLARLVEKHLYKKLIMYFYWSFFLIPNSCHSFFKERSKVKLINLSFIYCITYFSYFFSGDTHVVY